MAPSAQGPRVRLESAARVFFGPWPGSTLFKASSRPCATPPETPRAPTRRPILGRFPRLTLPGGPDTIPIAVQSREPSAQSNRILSVMRGRPTPHGVIVFETHRSHRRSNTHRRTTDKMLFVGRLVNTEDEAKDVTQDIWLNVVRKIDAVRDPAAFPAWLYKVARTHAASHFRKTPSFETLPEDGSAADVACTNVNDLSSMLNAEELHWALGHLSPPHSECLILHFLEGFSLEEVGSITDVPLGTVKSRIHYAKNALRDVLTEEALGNEE